MRLNRQEVKLAGLGDFDKTITCHRYQLGDFTAS
jgi:hypothetical protein